MIPGAAGDRFVVYTAGIGPEEIVEKFVDAGDCIAMVFDADSFTPFYRHAPGNEMILADEMEGCGASAALVRSGT
jgi:hypothetical protein